MQGSEAFLVTAVFASEDEALAGAQALFEAGLSEEQVRIPAGCVVRVSVANAELDRIAGKLRAAGARDVSAAACTNEPGWMSRIGERATGAKVMPGQGDSEAGSD